jgi:TonB family protein
MAFRALLFSRSSETNEALTTACAHAGIRVEVCNDIFTAIKKGTQQEFSCLLADWSDQPDAGFLLKRSRESGPNKSLVVIAIVEKEPTTAEMRDHQLKFLIYRPIVAAEAEEVLGKAIEVMEPVSGEDVIEAPPAYEPARESVTTSADDSTGRTRQAPPPRPTEESSLVKWSGADSSGDTANDIAIWQPPPPRSHASPLLRVCAAALVLAAGFLLWSARDVIRYLAGTSEGTLNVLKEAVASLYALPPTEAVPSRAATPGAQQDPYFSRPVDASTPQSPKLGVAATEADLGESHMELRKAADFPLPTPEYQRPKPEPVHTRVQTATIPDSLRSSAPITPPVVVTVNPAQMMPVSAPAMPPTSTQTIDEQVSVSEESQRALLVTAPEPAYPTEALAQKLHGSVVLQAKIGRDGKIEDLKIVRGYFVLGKAAIAAVKQWRFQPYLLNGRPAETQTTLTVTFSVPAS